MLTDNAQLQISFRQSSLSLLSSSKLPIRMNKSDFYPILSTQKCQNDRIFPTLLKLNENLCKQSQNSPFYYSSSTAENKKKYLQSIITDKLKNNRKFLHLKLESDCSETVPPVDKKIHKLGTKICNRKFKNVKPFKKFQIRLIRKLINECRKLRKSIIKPLEFQYEYLKIETSEFTAVTTPKSFTHPRHKISPSIDKSTIEDQFNNELDDTLNDVTDFLSLSPSTMAGSKSLYETATNDSYFSKNIKDYKFLNKSVNNSNAVMIDEFSFESRKSNSSKCHSSHIFVSVLEKQFPKFHLLYPVPSVDLRKYVYIDGKFENKIESIFNCSKFLKKSSFNFQSNNSNIDNENNVDSHQYFKHAQQLLSSNSSQMQYLMNAANAHFDTQNNGDIRSYVKGQLNEPRENVSTLKEKLNKIKVKQTPDNYSTNNKAFYKKIMQDKLPEDRETTHFLLDQEHGRKAIDTGSVMFRHREKQIQNKIKSQSEEYNQILSHASMVKSKSELERRGSFLESERLSKSCEDNKSDVETDEGENSIPESSVSQYDNKETSSTKSSIKTVSFAEDFNKPEYHHIRCNCDNQQDYSRNYEKEFKSIGMTLNNLVRRMNNLELNFQELSSVCLEISNSQSKYGQWNNNGIRNYNGINNDYFYNPPCMMMNNHCCPDTTPLPPPPPLYNYQHFNC